MFNRIRRWNRRRTLIKKQAIFPYYNGEKHCSADPFAGWRALLNHPTFNLQTMAPLVENGEEPETTMCVEAVADIFNITRWDAEKEIGLTEMHVLMVLDRFDNFLGDIKKNFSPGATSSPTTDSESSTSKERQNETTNSSSPSTSTSNEPNSAEV